MVSYNKIVEIAKKQLKSVKEENTLAHSYKWAYYFACALINPRKNVKSIKFGKATKPTGHNFKKKVPMNFISKWGKALVTYVKQNGKMPSCAVWGNINISPQTYCYLYAKALIYYDTIGKYPDSIYVDTSLFKKQCKSPYVSQPHFLNSGSGFLGQINSSNCGPHSVRQALKKFGIYISEATLAQWAGTVIGSGTDHQGLLTAIAKAGKENGVKLTAKWISFKSLGNNDAERFKKFGELICQPNIAAFTHIGYQCSGECSSGEIFGHYEYIDRINTSTNYVRALNSLGEREGNGYYGHLQDRTFALEAHYISQISQDGICIITKE